nr:hypothetical protein [Pseudomonas aeruginosa]
MSDLPSPKKHKTSNWSAIWVLPLVALAIGAWLGWRAYEPLVSDDQGFCFCARKSGKPAALRTVIEKLRELPGGVLPRAWETRFALCARLQ